MSKITHITLLIISGWMLLLAANSCINDDSDLSEAIAVYQIQPEIVEVDSTALLEDSDVVVTDINDKAYSDYVENTNWTRSVYIHFDGDTAYVTNNESGVTTIANGAHLIVVNTKKKVQFIVSGTTANGSLKFYSQKKFKLLLNGVNITNPYGAAINNQCGKSFYVVLGKGTHNELHDAASYAIDDDTDTEEDEKGALFSEGQILLSGSGSLNVYAIGKAGISTDDYLRVRPGVRLYVNSIADNGIRAKDGIIIDGGVINVEVYAAGAKALRSKSFVTVNGGRIVALSYGEPLIASGDTTACAALRCDSLLTMNGGTLKLKTTGDGAKALRAKADVVHIGGQFYAVALGTKLIKAAKGIKIDGNLNVSGGYFYSYSAKSDPLDVAGTTTIADGYKTYELNSKVLTIEY